MFRKAIGFAAGSIAMLWGAAGCYDSRFDAPAAGSSCEAVTETIATLRGRYAGSAFSITSPVVVAGTVTSSDREGNFYRSFCIEEEGAALEIMAGIDQLHNDFPEGCRVVLRLEGLTVGESRGVLQVGRAPQAGSEYEVDYLGSRAALDRHVSRCGEALQPIVPERLSINELAPGSAGTLVCIDQVRYTPEDLTAVTWAGYKRFTDKEGNEIYTYVRTYADFADEEVPVGWVSLTGILQYDDSGEGRYLIKLRDENDCLH